MSKKRAGVFYRVKKNEEQPGGLTFDKTRATRFLNGFIKIPGKGCVKRVHNDYAFLNVGI